MGTKFFSREWNPQKFEKLKNRGKKKFFFKKILIDLLFF